MWRNTSNLPQVSTEFVFNYKRIYFGTISADFAHLKLKNKNLRLTVNIEVNKK